MIITVIISAWYKRVLLLIMKKTGTLCCIFSNYYILYLQIRIFQMKKNAPLFAECHLVRASLYNLSKPPFFNLCDGKNSSNTKIVQMK